MGERPIKPMPPMPPMKPMPPPPMKKPMPPMKKPPHMPMHYMPMEMHMPMKHHHHGMKEPYFFKHLMEMRGRMVEVATTCKTLKGRLKEVLPDHILLETKECMHCHIRLKEICFVCPLMDP